MSGAGRASSPGSEVSRLNRAPGVPLQVSPETLDLLLSCDHWHEQTEGAFSVMIGGALSATAIARASASARRAPL